MPTLHPQRPHNSWLAGSQTWASASSRVSHAWLDQEMERLGGAHPTGQQQTAQQPAAKQGAVRQGAVRQEHGQHGEQPGGGRHPVARRRNQGRPGRAGAPARRLSPQAAAAGAVGRHCWIVDAERWPGPWPALLLEWRKDESTGAGWGRCLLAGAYSPQGLTVTDTWISAEHLRPIVLDALSPDRKITP